jgi:hypothetical protein
MTRGIAAFAALLLTGTALAGCGGGDKLNSPKAIADTLGCSSSYKNVQTEELGVDQAGSCRFNGQTVRLLTFADSDAQDTFLKIARSFGGRYAEGDGYLVEVKGAAVQKAAEDKLG